MKIALTDKQARIVRWWAKRNKITNDQVIDHIFRAFFHVVSGEFERDAKGRRKAKR